MKGSKKSLLASGVSLLASVALLAGTTFAWFTDSVVNTGNKIQAGNLAIGAYAYDLAEDGEGGFKIEGVNGGNPFKFETEGQNLKTDKNPIISEELFEPGKSNAKLLKVENEGTLAAKIKLDFTVEDGGLMEALWFDFVKVENGAAVGSFTRRPMNTLETFAENLELPLLEKGDNVQFILIYGMDENAGNAFKEKSFTADVAILATQAPAESDGFGNTDYDKEAKYARNKTIYIDSGEVRTINLDEMDYDAGGYDGVICAQNGGQVTLEGDGTVIANDQNNYAMAVWATGEGSKVTINGGTYINNIAYGRTDDQMDMIYASEGGDIEITGGTFKCATPKWTLNIQDGAYKDGTSTIVVKGGSFFEYDPSNATNENPAANFVAEGYKVVTEERADGTWYTVVPE